MGGPTQAQSEWEQTSAVHGPRFAPGSLPGEAPRLVIFGAVPVAAALCRGAVGLGWEPVLVDPRVRHAGPAAFPDAARILHAWPDEAFAALGGLDRCTAVAAVTHAPELDDPALVIALRSPAFYVGAIGSRRTQAARRERLACAGLTAGELDRLSGPAGLDLGGVTAAEAALAILAEAVAALHGRDGGRLTESPHAIHPSGRP